MRKYREATYWQSECPGCKGYILIAPAGGSFVWRASDAAPEGRYCLLGVIE